MELQNAQSRRFEPRPSVNGALRIKKKKMCEPRRGTLNFNYARFQERHPRFYGPITGALLSMFMLTTGLLFWTLIQDLPMFEKPIQNADGTLQMATLSVKTYTTTEFNAPLVENAFCASYPNGAKDLKSTTKVLATLAGFALSRTIVCVLMLCFCRNILKTVLLDGSKLIVFVLGYHHIDTSLPQLQDCDASWRPSVGIYVVRFAVLLVALSFLLDCIAVMWFCFGHILACSTNRPEWVSSDDEATEVTPIVGPPPRPIVAGPPPLPIVIGRTVPSAQCAPR